MSYKRLFILVEGLDDERFFEYALKLHFVKKYDHVQITRYAHMKNEKIRNLLTSIKAMRSDYLFFSDINNASCLTLKKEEIKTKLRNIVHLDKTIVVIKEIESWYLAGITENKRKSLKIRTLHNTNEITKEDFDSLIPKKFTSRIDFMIEILKKFSFPTAKRKNKSFKYFSDKHLG